MPSTITQYYQSHKKLSFIGEAGQQKISTVKILVIGAGGLGCPCLQWLAGCGFSVIGIIDFDTVSLSNLHRQVLFTMEDIGKPKALVAAEKLSKQNPFIKIQAHQQMVDDSNVLSLLKEYDLIIDCTDNFLVRYLINDACVYLDKPLVYGAIHLAEGHVTVFNYRQSPTLRCLFPESDSNKEIQSCADIGAYNITTGIVGLMMANEAVKIVTDNDEVLAGKLNQFDAISGKIISISYKPSAGGREKSLKRFQQIQPSIEITVEELLNKINNKESFTLIDVRENHERALFNIGGEHIPLSTFLNSMAPLPSTDTIIIYCQHGIRSLKAAAFLQKKGYTKVQSLQGGMHWWQQKIK
jgi:molybdopterin/thiamine biosynthesis adenylyltransferase/rhodanese-related sulfurtransferase